jgi:hypothetical protein
MKISKPRNATKLFLLSAEDAIIAFSSEPDARRTMADGDVLLGSPDDLKHITANWPNRPIGAFMEPHSRRRPHQKVH